MSEQLPKHASSIVVGQGQAAIAHAAIMEQGLMPAGTPQTYADGAPFEPGSGNVRVGWETPESADPTDVQAAVAQGIGDIASRSAVSR